MPVTLGGVSLPSDLLWADEFAWTPVAQATHYTLAGALVVEVGTRQAGRPVTLEADGDRAWITRTTLAALYALASVPSAGLALTLADGRQLTVIWRHDERAIEARPVVPVSPPGADAYYTVTLRLMEV